jgi:hypothetical protein
MKRFYLLTISLLVATFSCASLYAQQDFGKETTMSRQEARKAARAAHKKAVEAENQQLFEQSVQCLKEGEFVIEVDQILFPNGMNKYVSFITNFVSMNEGKSVVQVSTSNFNPGPNGLGGITVQGSVSNITMSTKKGVVYYNYAIQGALVSATINIVLAGSNRATVTIFPNFNNNNLTMIGKIVPPSQSQVYKGMTI